MIPGGLLEEQLTPLVQAVLGPARPLRFMTVYGIRCYEPGAVLLPHFDSCDRPVSLILPVLAEGAGVDWPLQIEVRPSHPAAAAAPAAAHAAAAAAAPAAAAPAAVAAALAAAAPAAAAACCRRRRRCCCCCCRRCCCSFALAPPPPAAVSVRA